MAVISKTGGASGPLYGTFLMDAGKAAPDGHLTLSDWATMMRAGLEGVQKRGKAKTGEKTMVDALIPAVEALDEAVSGGVPGQKLSCRPRTLQRTVCMPPRRLSQQRDELATSVSGAKGTRIRVKHRRTTSLPLPWMRKRMRELDRPRRTQVGALHGTVQESRIHILMLNLPTVRSVLCPDRCIRPREMRATILFPHLSCRSRRFRCLLLLTCRRLLWSELFSCRTAARSHRHSFRYSAR